MRRNFWALAVLLVVLAGAALWSQSYAPASLVYQPSTGQFHGTTSNGVDQILASAAGTVTVTIANGTATMGTGALSANTCASVVTVSAAGVNPNAPYYDVMDVTPNADITAITGFGALSTEGLTITWYPTTNNVNFKVCNGTGNSITPGSAAVLNWAVRR